MRGALAAALGIAGCVSQPAPPPCSVRALAEVNSLSTDEGPWLSPDHLELFFASDRDARMRIYRATRPTPTVPFSIAALVTSLDDGLSTYYAPSLSDDGLDIWFTSANVPTNSTNLYHARRAARGADFDPTSIAQVPSILAIAGSVDSAETTLAFDTTENTLGLATRGSTDMDFGSAKSLPAAVSTRHESHPSLSGSDDTLLFARKEGDGHEAIYRVGGGPYFDADPPAPEPSVAHVDGTDDDSPQLDRDGRTIAFSSNRADPGLADYDLYLACE